MTTTNSDCTKYGHLLNSLYPRSQYRCDACNTVHGTHAYNCAVNWQCPNELILNGTYHKPANQTYIGELCSRCNVLVSADDVRAMIAAENKARAEMWNRVSK